MNVIPSNAGVLLVAHGTRDAAGVAEARILADRASVSLAPRPVEIGFIELVEPTIGGAFDWLVQQGVGQIRVVPLLLFAAGHAKADLPQAIAEAALLHRDVEISIAAPFGLDNHVFALSRRRFEEAVANRRPLGPHETFWLLVGRGSSDVEAIGEFERFARQQAGQLKLVHFGYAFAAAAQPTLEAGLKQAEESAHLGVKRIVVQPHLLFRGEVLSQIEGAVARLQAKCPSLDWVQCAHLGPEQELVDATIQRAVAPDRETVNLKR